MGEVDINEGALKSLIFEINKFDREHIFNVNNIDTINDEDLQIRVNYSEENEYILSIRHYDYNRDIYVDGERCIGLLKFASEIEFMDLLNILNEVNLDKYDYKYYSYYYKKFMDDFLMDTAEEINVIVNDHKHIITDETYYNIRGYLVNDDDGDEKDDIDAINDFIENKRFPFLLKQLFEIYMYEYAKFEYLDDSKILMKINDLTFEIPVKIYRDD